MARTYEFTLFLSGNSDDLEPLTEALGKAGITDNLPGSFNDVLSVDFFRDADTLEEAISSAIRDVIKFGHRVERVELIDDEIEKLCKS